MNNFGEKANFIFGIADLIRDTFNRGKYRDVILPFTVRRRIDYVLHPTSCRSAYLWEEIWHPDSILNLIKNFIQLTPENRLIFPRYHQLDAVRKLLADSLAKGAGQRYLIQHSAGSGKSNTIAWLSHQLKNLFDPNDQRVFNSIIVISDRNIVNKQLQDNIQQFEQVRGTVATPKKGAELKKALQDGKQVIVCSLFLFPQVLRVTSQMLNQRFAVLIDEAHSSQGGKTTRSMNAVLADVEEDDTVTLNGVNYTEYSMNTASAGENIHDTAEAFKKDEFRILIVADKFQTGFDQPLLHTMYVDKPLRDIKAVQTLSRLNRCHPGKNETMVLDFVNDWQTIKNAFQDYYTATTLSEGTEPNRLYTLQRQLKQFDPAKARRGRECLVLQQNN